MLAPTALIAHDVAPVAVHRHRQDRIVEACALAVEVQERVRERVGHAVAVQGLVRVRHVDAGLEQLTGQVASGARLAAPREHLVAGLAPDVRALAEPLERLERERVVGEHAERRDDIVLEVLVLIVAPHQDEVGPERVDLLALGAERAEDALAVRLERRDALVVPPFGAHGLGPAGGVFQVRRNPWVTLEHARQRPRLQLVGH